MTPNRERIEAALQGLSDLPTPIHAWLVKVGRDAADDPAVWVWAILERQDVDVATREEVGGIVRALVRRQTDGEAWPYVQFRGAWEDWKSP